MIGVLDFFANGSSSNKSTVNKFVDGGNLGYEGFYKSLGVKNKTQFFNEIYGNRSLYDKAERKLNIDRMNKALDSNAVSQLLNDLMAVLFSLYYSNNEDHISIKSGKSRKEFFDNAIHKLYSSSNFALGGGIMTETVSDKVKKGFSIIEFQEILDEYFPYNFGFRVFKPKKMNFGTAKIEPDYDEAPSSLKGYSDGHIGGKLFFPQYKTDHNINFKVYQGGENTYFNFMLLDKEHNIWVGTFGFKDLGDVDATYITGFIAFLMECYGLAFNIKHSVYESGGNIQDTKATVLVISSKNPLAKQIGSGWSYIYNSHGVNLLEKDNNKYIVFPLSYISQVDKNVIKDDIEYIKKNFGIVEANWKSKDEEKFAMSDFTYSEGGSINKIERYLIWQNIRNDEYQWSVVIDNERIIGTININKYSSNYDVEPKVNIEDFDVVETSNKAIKLFEENKDEILQFVINQIGRQYVFSQGQKFQNGGQFLKVEVVINSDYDNSKKFSNFKAAKKYVLDNIDKADHEIIDQYGDSIFIEKDSTQEDLDFLFSNIKEEE